MKKRFMFILMVICLVSLLVGCGGKSNSIRKLIKHETSKDKIKFNNIEWLTKIEDVENSINSLLHSIDDEAKTDFDISENLPQGITEHRYVIQYENRDKSIGKLAGWDIISLAYDAINIESLDDNQYVCFFSIQLASNDVYPSSIYSDISGKLQTKYGKPYKSGEQYGVSYEYYGDSNGNEVILRNQGSYVMIDYWCNDVEDYIKSVGSNGL